MFRLDEVEKVLPMLQCFNHDEWIKKIDIVYKDKYYSFTYVNDEGIWVTATWTSETAKEYDILHHKESKAYLIYLLLNADRYFVETEFGNYGEPIWTVHKGI